MNDMQSFFAALPLSHHHDAFPKISLSSIPILLTPYDNKKRKTGPPSMARSYSKRDMTSAQVPPAEWT